MGLGVISIIFAGAWVDLDDRRAAEVCSSIAAVGDARGLGSRSKAEWLHAIELRDHRGESKTRPIATRIGYCRNRGHGRAVGPWPLPWAIARSGEGLEPARDRKHFATAKGAGARAVAERGLRRLEAALDKTGPEGLIPILKAIGLTSMERVDNLETLKRIVVDLEASACSKS